MAQHTAGPWSVRRGGSLTIIDTNREPVAHVQRRGHLSQRLSETESPHNAALIAAAPDLLEAIKEALRELDNITAPTDEISDAIGCVENLLRAAITKAEGRI